MHKDRDRGLCFTNSCNNNTVIVCDITLYYKHNLHIVAKYSC